MSLHLLSKRSSSRAQTLSFGLSYDMAYFAVAYTAHLERWISSSIIKKKGKGSFVSKGLSKKERARERVSQINALIQRVCMHTEPGRERNKKKRICNYYILDCKGINCLFFLSPFSNFPLFSTVKISVILSLTLSPHPRALAI